jgi:hypothetical protein
MPSIYLEVPFVTQLGFGNKADPQNDPTGCWYRSACMVAFYFEAGPRLGDPSLYTRNVGTFKNGTPMTGHQPIQDTTTLQKNENLVEVPYPASKKWSTDDLAALLRKWGPQLISWTKTHNGASYGHCSALIGVNDKQQQVIIHDPENAPNTKMSLKKFNEVFMWGISDSMLRKDLPAHTPKINLRALANLK